MSNSNKTLLVSGCSYTWGSELHDATDDVRSSSTWANQLSNNVTNVSLYSASNEWIARSVMDNYADHELVVVMWTFPSRFLLEFAADSSLYATYGPYINVTPWQAEKNWDTIASTLTNCKSDIVSIHKKKHELAVKSGLVDAVHHLYKAVGHCRIHQLLTSWKSIANTAQYLKNRNISAVFTFANSDLFGPELEQHEDLFPLYRLAQCIDWVSFYGQGFDEWAKSSDLPYGVSHPLEQAHATGGKYLQQQLKELGIL